MTEEDTGPRMNETATTPETPGEDRDQPVHFEIRIKGHLDQRWAGWFDGLTLTLEENGETRITGPVVDQASLHGLLKKVRDLSLPLIAVNPITPDVSASEIGPQVEDDSLDGLAGKEGCP